MATVMRIKGRGAQSWYARNLHSAVIAGLLGMAPLAASSAALADAGADAGAAGIEPATSAAMIELVPIQPAADITAPAAEPFVAAPSAPQETALGRGSASYYAAKFHGRRTASGEAFDNRAMTAAHRTLPFGSLVRVTNPASGASVVVRINDRGPFTRGRMIDVSRAAAEQLGLIAPGHATVELALVEG
jgi:rare lipoprotein A